MLVLYFDHFDLELCCVCHKQLDSKICLSNSIDQFLKVFLRFKAVKNNRDVAKAPKTDDYHYYGIYYKFDQTFE